MGAGGGACAELAFGAAAAWLHDTGREAQVSREWKERGMSGFAIVLGAVGVVLALNVLVVVLCTMASRSDARLGAVTMEARRRRCAEGEESCPDPRVAAESRFRG